MIVATDAKELAHRMIDEMPDGVSLDDILYTLYFRHHVDQGLREADAGDTISHDEMLEELARWSLSAGHQGRDVTSA